MALGRLGIPELLDAPDATVAQELGTRLGLVGRFSDAAPLFEEIRNVAPTVNQFKYEIEALWGAGRLDEAERLLDEAMSIYAANPSIWRTRFDLHLFGGRARAAIAMVQDVDSRPPELAQQHVDDLMRLALALDTRASSEVARLVDHETRSGRTSANEAKVAIRNLSAVGSVDEAYAFADAYFFSRGFVIPDGPARLGEQARATLAERQTDFLFQPLLRALRRDTRFTRLTGELGLQRYWKEANASPDYKRLEVTGERR